MNETLTHDIGNVEVLQDTDGLIESFRLKAGTRTLILHTDVHAIRRQLGPARYSETKLPPDGAMIQGISTDAIIAARPDCYYFDPPTLGQLLLRTLKVDGAHPIPPGTIVQGNFGAIAAGADWGCGSSRENAAHALLGAGIGAVYAPSIAPIHLDNLVANGMFPIFSRDVFERLINGHTIAVAEIAPPLTEFQRRIMLRGNIFRFMRAWVDGKEPTEPITTGDRPMTIVEKIMAAKMDTVSGHVRPGDAGMLKVDRTLCHDYTTAQIASMIRTGLGRPAQVKHPSKHYAFSDHLELMEQGQAGATDEEVYAVRALRDAQIQVVKETGIMFPQRDGGGSAAICHQYFREQVATPGQVIVGTDSHTCAGGFANAYAFGVGSSSIAIAWEHDVIQSSVPETIRVEFSGTLPRATSGKDVMLYLAYLAKKRAGKADQVQFTGRVLEYGGEGLQTLTADDQWVLTNMATECSARTGIVAPNPVLRRYLVECRGLQEEAVDRAFVWPDRSADYADVIQVNLTKIVPAISMPGHTGNMVALGEAAGTRVDMAYSGSCTSGSYEVLQRLAELLDGKHVAIPMHVQAGSEQVLQRAKDSGIVDMLERAGVVVIEVAGCGACLAAGPGGPALGQSVISTTNRNFDGRMGEGDAYLANVGVVAVTALLGKIPTMEEYVDVLGQAKAVGE